MPFNPLSALTSKLFGGLAIMLALGLATQTIRIEGFLFIHGFKQQVVGLRIDLDRVKALRMEERLNHRQTKKNIRDAQFRAAQLEQARLARVNARQKEITDDVAQDYAARLAALRARVERLRHDRQGGAIAGSAPGCEPVPGVSVASGGTAQAPADCGLPGSTVRADQFERDVVASEQAEQLDALITFVTRQGAVDPNETAR